MPPVQQPAVQSRLHRSPAVPVDGACARTNAGYLAPGQGKISVNVDQVSINAGATVPLPKPPSGKSWLLTDLYFSHDQNAAVRFALAVGSVTLFSCPVHGSAAPDALPGIETQTADPAAQQLKLVMGAAGGKGYANLAGVLQGTGGG